MTAVTIVFTNVVIQSHPPTIAYCKYFSYWYLRPQYVAGSTFHSSKIYPQGWEGSEKPIVVHARHFVPTLPVLHQPPRVSCRIAINSRLERHSPKVAVEVQLIISSSVDIEAINSTNFKAGRGYIEV